MHTGIHAVIVSADPVSSAVLSRALKEWWCAEVTCVTYGTAKEALNSQSLECADIVFVSEVPDDEELHSAVKSIRAQASAPLCFVVSATRGQDALAAALRAGARDCINRYVVDEDDIHRCLWSVLKERAATHLRAFIAMPQPAGA